MSVATPSQSPIPADALEQHPNRWIAIRDGQVVAVADEYDELMADDGVEATDTIYHVPPSSTLFY
jgi:hypothetical protein